MTLARLTIGEYDDAHDYILDIGNYSIEEINCAIKKSVDELNLSHRFLNELSAGYSAHKCVEELREKGYGIEDDYDYIGVIIVLLSIQDIFVKDLELEKIDFDIFYEKHTLCK